MKYLNFKSWQNLVNIAKTPNNHSSIHTCGRGNGCFQRLWNGRGTKIKDSLLLFALLQQTGRQVPSVAFNGPY